MSLDDIQLEAEEKMSNTIERLRGELRGIRTGRASTALVEHIKVEYFGATTELRSIAQLTTPESNMIVIKPFDPSSCKDIERAIMASELGITPNSDGRIIRLVLPPLSGERRKQLAQQVRQLAEQAKIAIRNVRRDSNKKIDAQQKAGELPEDDADRGKQEIQDLTKEYETKADEVVAAKIKEIQEM